jgi:Uma2 family endonuclease
MVSSLLIQPQDLPVAVDLSALIQFDSDSFFEFCRANEDLQIERTAKGEIIVMSLAGWESDARNAEITAQLRAWAKQEGSGVATGPTAGFDLPNGAMRAPDGAWVRRERLEALTPEQKKKFLPLCPDFVIELRSESDRLKDLREKMEEYIANGARLGWLIDPQTRQVHVYRPGATPEAPPLVEVLDNPATVSGGAALPGFVLSLAEVWEAGA